MNESQSNRIRPLTFQSNSLLTALVMMCLVHVGAAGYARAADCNNNGIEDAIDLAVGTSLDCDQNGVPDECQANIVSENFNSYSPLQDPANWFDTAADSSTVELDNFNVEQVGSDLALGVFSTSTNIHSHYVGPGAANISSMTFTGRMRLVSADGGIGVTFLSQFSDQPSSTYEYLRIRRAAYAPSAQTFHLAPPNFDNFVGDKDSGVDPAANTWYRFRIIVDTAGSQLHVQANFWEDGQPEPAGFQIDAIDATGQHPTSGTIGVWSMGNGGKYWDDLEVIVDEFGVPCDDLDACTTADECLSGVCTGTPVDCSQLDDACVTGACNPSTGSCETAPINEGGGCDDLDACTTNDECTAGTCSGDSVDCSHLDDGCTVGVCNQSNGQCETAPAGEGSACDDLDACTVNESCTGGVCAGTPLDCSYLNNACLPGTCNPGTGLCEAPTVTDDCNTNGVPDECEFSLNSQYSNVVAPDGSATDQFGFSVDIEGTIGVIGAQWGSKTGVSRSGSAYVFQEIDGVWQYEMEITASDAAFDDRFGYSVSISGNTIVVGANRNDDDGTNSGSAYIFRSSNGVWQQIAKVTANDASSSDFFGTSVAIAGNTVLIGAHGNDDDGSRSGSAYVFREIGGNWQQIAKLTADDASSDNFFGHTLALAGDTAVIGAYGGTKTGVDESGAAYVFSEVEGVWQQIEKLTASDAASGDRFGFDVAIHGNTIVVGAYLDDAQPVDTGAAYVFRETGGMWSQIAKLTVDDLPGGDYLGFSVAIHGSRIALGAPLNSENGPESGAVYATREVGGVWRQPTRIATFNSDTDDELGSSVALNGDSVLVGAYKDVVTASNNGSAHFHSFGILDCNTNGILDECDIESGVETDCNLNGVPDACEPFGENSQDCSFLDDACVLGVCNLEAGACETIPANEGGLCDDLDLCTTDDACVDGACLGIPLDCSYLDVKCVAAACNAGDGMCDVPAFDDCDLNGSPDECEFDSTRVKLDNSSTLGGMNDLTFNRFGKSVALSGNIAIVGNPEASTHYFFFEIPKREVYLFRHGRAHVFEKINGVWWDVRDFRGGPFPDSSDPLFLEGQHLGTSVAVSNKTVVIGAPRFDSDGPYDSGAVTVYDREINGYWSFGSKLKASDPATGDGFGSRVAISDNTIVVGRPGDNTNGQNSGATYVFQRESGTWLQTAKLTADDGSAGGNFGLQVSASGSTIIIGATSSGGSVYVFKEIGGVWQQVAKLTADDTMDGDLFGANISISGNTALVGAQGDDIDEVDAGSAYVFREIGGVWQQIAKLVAEDGAKDDFFGSSVSISGNTAVIGAPGDDNPMNGGATYVFREFCGVWQQVEKLVNTELTAYENFGASCAIDGETAIVGTFLPSAFGQGDLFDLPGDVYVFDLPQVDLNNNGVPDDCDIANGTSFDCNTNGGPDDCEDLTIIALPSTTECPGTVITLDAGSGFSSYQWEPGGETSRTIQVTTPGTYRATVTGGAGSCVASHSIGVAFSGSEPGVPAVLVSSKLTNSVVAIDAQTGKMLFEYIPPATNGLNDPNGITVDSAGHVYVSSVNTQSVMKFAAFTGELIREYTGALTDPVGLLIADPDTLLVSNWSDDSVHKFDVVTGQVLGQLVASGAGGLDGPADLLLTPAGELLVSSQKSDRVLAYDAESGASSHIAAQGGGLETPAGLLLDSQGNLLVASFSTDQVLRFDPSTGTLIDVFVGDDPTTISVDESGGLDGSEGLAWSANGNLLVSNRYGASVLEYDGTTGTFVRALGTGKVNQPTYLTMTSLDRDCNEDRIPDYCDTDTGVAGMDCNFNGIGDKCDAASVGDFDANGTLDLIDFGYLADCQAGPGTSSTPSDGGCVAMCFQVFDADADGDIDLQDFAAFQRIFDP